MKKIFFACIAGLMLLASCEKIEPTALVPSESAEVITLKGYVKYDPKDADLKTNVKVIEDVPVYIDVELNQYNDKAAGFKTFQTKADMDGFYTIEIPAKTGAAVNFKAWTEFEEDGYYILPESSKATKGTCVFRGESEVTSCKAGQTVMANIVAQQVAQPEEEDLN